MRISPAFAPPAVRVFGAWLSIVDGGLVRGAVANAAVAVVDEQRRRQQWTSDDDGALAPAVPLRSGTAAERGGRRHPVALPAATHRRRSLG